MSGPLIDRVIAELRTGNATARQIVARLNCAASPVSRHIRTLHGIRAIHVAFYQTGANNQQEAVFGWGDQEDAPLPEARKRKVEANTARLPRPVPLGPWGCAW
jgi:hypothetical protein